MKKRKKLEAKRLEKELPNQVKRLKKVTRVVDVQQDIGAQEAKDIAFAHAYIKNRFNAAQAYREIIPNASNEAAKKSGYVLRQRPAVSKLIAKLINEYLDNLVIDGNNIMRELTVVAFCDIASIVDYNKDANTFNIKDFSEMGIWSKAIKSFKINNHGLQVELYNKMGALELLGKAKGVLGTRDFEELDMTELEDYYKKVVTAMSRKDTAK